MTSSLLYAYIRSYSPRSTTTPSPSTNLYIPITNLPSTDLRLRREFIAVLKHADIELSQLLTLDDLPATSSRAASLKPENTRWILVDHNALQGDLGKLYSSRVVGVIDHHDEENAVREDTGDEPRIITNSGACTSLVTEYCRDAWDALSASQVQGHTTQETATWDAQVAQVALASVLIDTSNLTSKMTEHDQTAFEYLMLKIKRSPEHATSFNRDAFFSEISRAKKDLDPLSVRDVLRKDYKQWTIMKGDGESKQLGMSSVVKSLSWLDAKAKAEGTGLIDVVKDYVESVDLQVFALMTAKIKTSQTDGNVLRKELLIYSRDQDCVGSIESFEKTAKDELGLEDWVDEKGLGLSAEIEATTAWCRIYRQKAVEKGRKQVAPLLRKALEL